MRIDKKFFYYILLISLFHYFSHLFESQDKDPIEEILTEIPFRLLFAHALPQFLHSLWVRKILLRSLQKTMKENSEVELSVKQIVRFFSLPISAEVKFFLVSLLAKILEGLRVENSKWLVEEVLNHPNLTEFFLTEEKITKSKDFFKKN
jgi:hypothetical protein